MPLCTHIQGKNVVRIVHLTREGSFGILNELKKISNVDLPVYNADTSDVQLYRQLL